MYFYEIEYVLIIFISAVHDKSSKEQCNVYTNLLLILFLRILLCCIVVFKAFFAHELRGHQKTIRA